MSIIDIWEIIINFDLFKLPALIATITIAIIFFIKTLSWFLLIFLIIIIYFYQFILP